MTFLLIFNDLKYGKNSWFCCNGYSYAVFTILFFYKSQVEEIRKALTKEKKKAIERTLLLLFYYFFRT